MKISSSSREILRDYAKRVYEIGSSTEMQENIRRWNGHNSLKSKRPMLLCFPEGSWDEILPPLMKLHDDGPFVHSLEWHLVTKLYTYDNISANNTIEPNFTVSKTIYNTGYGVEAKQHAATENKGAWTFDPVIKSGKDLEKMKIPEVIYDEKKTEEQLELYNDILGDILPAKVKGVGHISFHPMSVYTSLRGLEEVMYDMYEEPEMLHDAMAFLLEANLDILKQYERLNVLSLNNDDTYQNSGGNGYTDDLPQKDFDPEKVRTIDMWGSAEAQEMAQVSPDLHYEFVLQYESRFLEKFGLTGYGCCEDLTEKLNYVLKIPNIRRISVSPWADVEKCAERIGDKAIFSWKPHPSHLVGDFDAVAVRKYIEKTVVACKNNNCTVEMILKDTHTCQNHPERFTMWYNIANEVIAEHFD